GYQNQLNGSPGPLLHYQWSTGDTTSGIAVSITGYYSVSLTTYDSCFVSCDTVFVIVNPLPPKPKITDSKGVNINTDNPLTIYLCKPDTVLLTVNNAGVDSIIWNGCAMPTGH